MKRRSSYKQLNHLGIDYAIELGGCHSGSGATSRTEREAVSQYGGRFLLTVAAIIRIIWIMPVKSEATIQDLTRRVGRGGRRPVSLKRRILLTGAAIIRIILDYVNGLGGRDS